MKLKKIIELLTGVREVAGKSSIDIRGISNDSKLVRDAYLFVATKGLRFNGADFINEAIERGAASVILELDEDRTFPIRNAITYIYVDEAHSALSESARAFYGDISSRMHLIGVTGTNGKTTTTYLLESLFNAICQNVGVIGTINYRFGRRLIPATNTTPGLLELYSLLRSMEKEGIENCIMEVSSHSLEQGRVDTLNFDIAIFTNLTSEHLDYHKNLENYLFSKTKLFTKIKKGGWAVVNIDDAYSKDIIEKVEMEKKASIITYGIEKKADVSAKDIEFSFEGLRFKLCINGKDFIDIESHLIGRHNVYNILASASCGIAMGIGMEEIKQGIEKVLSLPGRLERIDCGQDFLVFVDYAHTEDGLDNVLKTLRGLKPKRILTVFGCGGDRDRSKRPKMGDVSSRLSDKVFITSDNPRSEEPMEIVKQVVEGIDPGKEVVVEVDRFKAIDLALKEAKRGDIVLVAGKGHETSQVFKDTTILFDDREVVRKILREEVTRR